TISGTRGAGVPVNSASMNCKVNVNGTDGSRVEIIIVNEVRLPVKAMCLDGKILGCIRGEKPSYFEAYDIRNGHQLILNHGQTNPNPIVACDIAFGLVGLV